MASHIFHCVFPWLGRSIGHPWWGPHSIKWNRAGIWWCPGEKNPRSHFWLHISQNSPMMRGHQLWSCNGPYYSPYDHPFILDTWLLLFINHNFCRNVNRTRTKPWNISCFSYHSSNFLIMLSSADLIELEINALFSTLNYRITRRIRRKVWGATLWSQCW